MSNLYSRIDSIMPLLDGWCSVEKAHTLAAAVMSLRPNLSLEVGVWGGKSLIPMAMAHKEIGRGTVIGIDPWEAAASAEGQTHEKDKEWWNDQKKHDYVYDRFNHQLNALALQTVVVVNRARSDAVEPPDEIGLLHIDGNHSDQAVRDVQRFAPHVAIGGLVILDDIGWTGGGVSRAVGQLLSIGFRELYRVTDPNCWGVFRRVK